MPALTRRHFLAAASGALASAALADGVATSAPSSGTGFIHDERYLRHIMRPGAPESPQRLSAIVDAMHKTGLDEKVTHLPPIDDPMPWIKQVHSTSHIDKIRAIPTTGPIAELAVAGALAGVAAVSDGRVRNAFCAIRPPGHHAQNTGREEGFCYYNNVAVAARYAQSRGHARILIIDWDYHHGNGTEKAFWDDPTVLYFSTHDARAYPGTGSPSRKGGPHKATLGYNVNVDLHCGATDADMVAAWDRHLMPVVERFRPDVVLISAGFDSRVDDTLGCFKVTDIGFMQLTKKAMRIADAHCGGRLVSVLEGGYNVNGLALATCAHVKALLE